ncbi:MAG: hypothetical protein Q7J25_09350 [Vicinamibacterales bacterium]|nr:hypothetical protein [Vicinamibacterales bacterium]
MRPFVIRIAENGAIEEFASLTINPAHPRPTDAALLLHTCLARLPSLRLPNFPGFP